MTFTMVVFGSALEGGPPDIFFMVVHFGQIRIIQRFCSTFVGESKHPYGVCLCVYVCIYTHKLLGCSEAGAGAYSSLDFGISHQMPLIMDADSVACIFVGRSL